MFKAPTEDFPWWGYSKKEIAGVRSEHNFDLYTPIHPKTLKKYEHTNYRLIYSKMLLKQYFLKTKSDQKLILSVQEVLTNFIK